MPNEKMLTEADIKPGAVFVAANGRLVGQAFRVFATLPLLDGNMSVFMQSVEPYDGGSDGNEHAVIRESMRRIAHDGKRAAPAWLLITPAPPDPRDVRIEVLEAEKAALFDCGDSSGCAIAPGCVRHFAEQARTLLAEKAALHEALVEQERTVAACRADRDTAWARAERTFGAKIAALERQVEEYAVDAQGAAFRHQHNEMVLSVVTAQRDSLAAGLREALAASEAALAKEPVMCRHCGGTGRADSIDGAAECPQCGGNGTDDEREQFEEGINFLHGYWGLREGTAAAIARFRAIAESFHPTAQAPVTTGESAPGIVSPVATKDSVATVARGADDAWAAKLLRFILDDVTFDERHGDDGRRAVEHAIRALAP